MDANERAFYDKLFQVLRNFIEYGNYHSKQENAVKVLVKTFPDRPEEELSQLFNACCKAYADAIILVKENVGYYSKLNNSTILPAEKSFREKYKDVNAQMLSWIIGWIYHWHHER